MRHRAAWQALSLFGAVGLAAPTARAQDDAARWRDAVTAFEAFARADATVGGSLAVVRDGTVLRAHHVGFADRDTRTPVTNATIWHWGSITKTLTAVLTLQEAARTPGLLDTPLPELVPETRRIHHPFGGMRTITPRHLLSHTSGLQAGTWPWSRGADWEPFEPTEWSQLVAMTPYMQVAFPAGSRYSYSNPGIVYLARIVEQAHHETWESLVKKRLWMPLGIDSSYVNSTPPHLLAVRSRNYAHGREGVVAGGPDFNTGITTSNGGWNAPIGDLATWIAFLAGSPDPATTARHALILPRATVAAMQVPVIAVDSAQQMGQSLFVREVGGRRVVGHTGTQANFRSFFWLDPVTRTAVIGVVNTSHDVEGRASSARFEAMMTAAIRALGPAS
jgi:CubicO group peptidase (beta-lactamase class C family)